jgi:hypothetical protein
MTRTKLEPPLSSVRRKVGERELLEAPASQEAKTVYKSGIVSWLLDGGSMSTTSLSSDRKKIVVFDYVL